MALARDRIRLTADVVTAASTNYAPVTGLTLAVVSGKNYHVRGVFLYTVAATTTGVRFGFSAAPTTAATFMAMFGYGPDAIGTIDGGGNDDFVTTASTTGGYTALASSPDTTLGNLHIIEGIITPAAAQILTAEVGPEAAAAVTVKAGSFIEWEIV